MAVAEPILASTLWSAYQHQRTDDSDNPTAKRRRLNTGCNSIDEALNGGIDYGHGGICCISAEEGSAGRNLGFTFLNQHLTSSVESHATIIDSTLTLDVGRLHERVAKALLRNQRGLGEHEAAENARRILGRVKIMKVFDFIGLTEAVSEIRRDAQQTQARRREADMSNNIIPPPRRTVADSQDEGEEVALLPSPAKAIPVAGLPSKKVEAQGAQSFVIVQDLSTVLTPLCKSNYAQGLAMASSLMRSLQHLVHEHDFCIVILNGTTVLQPSKHEESSNISNIHEGSSSIFSSCASTPAFYRGLQWLVDLHLLVHSVPRREADSRAIHGERQILRGDGKPAEHVFVVEVLIDRLSQRYQRWAAFELDDSGSVRDVG